jgi:hypothetical protein
VIDPAPMLDGVRCACGREATANGRECGSCYRERLGSVSNGFTPTRGRARFDSSKGRKHMSRLERYKATREEGSQPASTRSSDIDAARAASDRTGKPFRSDLAGALRQG